MPDSTLHRTGRSRCSHRAGERERSAAECEEELPLLGTRDLWVFLLASFLLWITPGPDSMYILARTIAQGRTAGGRIGLRHQFRNSCAYLLRGLWSLHHLTTWAWAFMIVKISGAAYLIYLGVQLGLDLLRFKPQAAVIETRRPLGRTAESDGLSRLRRQT